jgi:hypothetical protein
MADENESPDLSPGALVRRLESAAQEQPIAEFVGHIGSSGEGQLRLYMDLRLSDFLEFERADVLDVIRPPEADAPARIFVRGAARVRRSSTTIHNASDLGGTLSVPSGSVVSRYPGWIVDLLSGLGGLFDPGAEQKRRVSNLKTLIADMRERG